MIMVDGKSKFQSTQNLTIYILVVINLLHLQGCADTIVDAISNNLGAIAGSVIVLALLQVRYFKP